MSLDKVPQLGSKPVSLTVKLQALEATYSDVIATGLRDMYRSGQFVDVSLLCAGQTLRAHRVVLATQSAVFKEGLAAGSNGAGVEEVRLAEIANPEAVQMMLDHIYQMDTMTSKTFNPRTLDINKDVLRLAQNFQLPGLRDLATHWLAKGLTTGNVVERLNICEEFSLETLQEKILEQLAFNRLALTEVACSPQILQHPKLMQELLKMMASAPIEEPLVKKAKMAPVLIEEPVVKKAKKFGA